MCWKRVSKDKRKWVGNNFQIRPFSGLFFFIFVFSIHLRDQIDIGNNWIRTVDLHLNVWSLKMYSQLYFPILAPGSGAIFWGVGENTFQSVTSRSKISFSVRCDFMTIRRKVKTIFQFRWSGQEMIFSDFVRFRASANYRFW